MTLGREFGLDLTRRRWMWVAVPVLIALILGAVFFVSHRQQKLPDHFVNISGSITSAEPIEDLKDATMSMQNQDLLNKVLETPDKWQGYELNLHLTQRSSGFNDKLSAQEWFVNPGQRWVKTDSGYAYEDLPEDPALIVGPWHGEEPEGLTRGTEDYKVRLVVNKEGKTAEQVQDYVDNITIDVQTTVLSRDKEVDYVMTPITWNAK